MGFFRTIFLLVFVYYLIRFINRYVVPMFRSRGKDTTAGPGPRKRAKNEPKFKDPGGEYIEFEEIKED